jgi:NIMA (never in mitosis gene a)-related kinase
MSKSTTLQHFLIKEKIGEGAFCSVFKVLRVLDQKTYALKVVHVQRLKPKELENALNEIRILASIRSKNIIRFREAYFDKSNKDLCIVMDLAENGDLS